MAATDNMRLFVAIFPPAPIVERLTEIIKDLADHLTPRAAAWTAPEQIHLTLNFLGNIGSARLAEWERALEQVSRAGEIHSLHASGLGCFPNTSRPRVLWAGLPDGPAAFLSLKESLDNSLQALGYAREDRPFHPHLTLGRVKDSGPLDRQYLRNVLREYENTRFGQWTVTQVQLMESKLSPRGARYSIVRSFPLRATPP